MAAANFTFVHKMDGFGHLTQWTLNIKMEESIS